MQYATYSPEDNKLRLYVGRVPHDEYLRLRAEGWTSTPKQDCDFVAHWTPARRDTALEYSEVIEDEDQSPEDRAADRAERFGGYRDKRTEEATGHADRYDAGPSAHGFQSQARAERAAGRHDRIAGRACDAWSKAEYWQRRTAGVISHALYVSSPSVRMGCIKTLEAELRKHMATREEWVRVWKTWKALSEMTDADAQTKAALRFVSTTNFYRDDFQHPRPESASAYAREHGTSLYSLMTHEQDPITGAEACALWFKGREGHGEPSLEDDWSRHYELRLGYERQMLEAQGGRAADVEMQVGGFLGGRQIYKVNKSNVTGRVVSVHVKGPRVQGWVYKAHNVPGTDYALYQIDTERLAPGAYRPPTPEELAAFEAARKAEKATKPKAPSCPLINPTDADAEKLQALWNEKAAQRKGEPVQILRLKQAQYSAHSGGTYASLETAIISEHGTERASESPMGNSRSRAQIFKLRVCLSGGGLYSAKRIVILSDKPQKPIPFAEIEAARAAQPSPDSTRPRLLDIERELGKAWLSDMDRSLINDAEYVGWVSVQSQSQIYWTATGRAALDSYKAAPKNHEEMDLFATTVESLQ
jgi:Domain of unknown function (DUF3560)